LDDVGLEIRHLIHQRIRRTPLLMRQLSIKDAQQSTERATHDGRLIGRRASDQKLDGNRDTRHKIYIG
jgi:hypothetical protein